VTALPGLRRGDHVGVVVPDLEAAITFFEGALGGQCVLQHGPYRGVSGDPDMQVRQFARHRDTQVEGIAVVHVADVVLELLQFSAPDQRSEPPRTSDAGGHHVAFYVDDLDGAVAHLRARGVQVLGEPMPLPGPESGEQARFVFALTPWGLALEFVSYPFGKAYQLQDVSAAAAVPADGGRPSADDGAEAP
jgi:catechol 2,3-dioxygenase-like lactoylglutathione lyase family enzyme